MTSLQSPSRQLRLAAFAAVGVTVLAGLSACEERPYSVPTRQAATPAPRVTELAGGPAYTAPPAAVAPPVYVAPSEPAYVAPPPPAQTYHPAPAYDSGEPMIVAMAPIPNPVEGGGRVSAPVEPTPPHVYTSPSRVHHVYGSGATYAQLDPAPRHAHVIHIAPTPTPAAPVVHTTHVAAAAPVHVAPAKPVVAAKPVQVAKAAPSPVLRKPVSPVTIVEKPPAGAAHAANGGKTTAVAGAAALAVTGKAAVHPTKPGAPAAPVDAEHDAKVLALQTALTDAVAKDAVLTLPAQFTPNQPADVSLSLPASFADTVHKEADKQGLTAEAATANMTASLAGDGYAATPSDMQAQPLTAGQTTEFHWTVISQPGAKGPLHADVGADLLGGGSTAFSLGAVQKTSGFKISNQVWGIGLLVLIVMGVLGWLARGRSRPVRDTLSNRMGDRPLDMGRDNT